MIKIRLEAVLREKGISKRGFAKLLGIDYANVFRFFRKGYDPKLSTLQEWAKTLGVKISDLYEEISVRPAKKQKE